VFRFLFHGTNPSNFSENAFKLLNAMYTAMFIARVNNWHNLLTHRNGGGTKHPQWDDYRITDQEVRTNPKDRTLPYIANKAMDFDIKRCKGKNFKTITTLNLKVRWGPPTMQPADDMRMVIKYMGGQGFNEHDEAVNDNDIEFRRTDTQGGVKKTKASGEVAADKSPSLPGPDQVVVPESHDDDESEKNADADSDSEIEDEDVSKYIMMRLLRWDQSERVHLR
jgi:hypothetical protein